MEPSVEITVAALHSPLSGHLGRGREFNAVSFAKQLVSDYGWSDRPGQERLKRSQIIVVVVKACQIEFQLLDRLHAITQLVGNQCLRFHIRIAVNSEKSWRDRHRWRRVQPNITFRFRRRAYRSGD